jgi:hypothetical protein
LRVRTAAKARTILVKIKALPLRQKVGENKTREGVR